MRVKFFFALLGLMAVSIGLGLFFPSPTLDTLCRYAPMAEAFARGEWLEAFHPRFGIGFPVLAGSLARLTRLDGNASCVVLAMLGWSLATIPLFRLTKRIAGLMTAWWVVVLFVVCPQPLLWAFQGLRETWRLCATLCAIAALFDCREHPTVSLVEMVVAQVVFLTFRADTILFAVLAGCAFAVVDRCRRRTSVLALLCLVAVIPSFVVTHLWTGWWLPSPHFIPLTLKIAGVS